MDAKEKNREKQRRWLAGLTDEERLKHREYHRAYDKEWSKRNREKIREKKRRMYASRLLQACDLLGGCCTVCGLKDHPCVYDFHHLRDKEFAISDKLIDYNWERIQTELVKCMLLCAPCHRKLHAGVLSDAENSKVERYIRAVSPKSDGSARRSRS